MLYISTTYVHINICLFIFKIERMKNFVSIFYKWLISQELTMNNELQVHEYNNIAYECLIATD